MRAKCIPQKVNSRYRFFLFMITPLLIGLFITMTLSSLAHAGPGWDRKDEASIRPSPITQGWIPFEEQDVKP